MNRNDFATAPNALRLAGPKAVTDETCLGSNHFVLISAAINSTEPLPMQRGGYQ
jgi:hypothetical protein